MKRCGRCGETKPTSDFYRDRQKVDGLQGQCKACQLLNTRAYRERHLDEVRARGRQHWLDNREAIATRRRERHEANPEVRRAQGRAWAAANPEKVKTKYRRTMLKRVYGITQEDYERMLATQGGTCAICRGQQRDGKAFAIDHDHATGQVRGLLCDACNTGIGLLGDDPDTLATASEYLRTHAATRAS